jgi:hypothetical protein
MRPTITGPIGAALVIATMYAPVLEAQRQPQTRQPTGPWQCEPTDPVRAFSRAVRADTMRARPAAAAVTGARVTGGTARSQEFPEYDVVLQVPNLCVHRLFLQVDSVTAKISLDARVANLVKVTAGADVLIGEVSLTIQGVRAQALLLVDLDDVVYIVDRTLTFVDNHPEVVQQLTSTLQTTVGAVGGLVRGLLLATTRNAAGQTVQRLVDEATGSIVERTLSAAGQAIAERAVGSILSLPVISSTTNQAGEVVRRVRDTASNRIIEYTLDRAGRLIRSRLP